MNTVIIDQDSLHFEICLLAIFLILEFDKSILQTITGPLVTDDFAG